MSGEIEVARWLGETSLGRGLAGKVRPAPAVKAPVRRVKLPQPTPSAVDIWAVLKNRRSRREYGVRPLALQELAALLWAAQGVTRPGLAVSLRTAPSAGALYPVNTYVALRRVEGLEAGLWRLDVEGFSLELLRVGPEVLGQLEAATLNQGAVKRAAAVFVFSATIERCSAKYDLRASRYIMLDAAHLCQNLLLGAEALNLSACPIGAFLDSDLNACLRVDGVREAAVLLATVGPR